MNMLKILNFSLAASLFAAAAQAASPPSLYTATQATAGAAVFAQSCAMCHGASLAGGAGPALVGPGFATSGTTVGSVFTMVAQQMPLSSPGSLSHAQYKDVMAYILQKNGYSAGGTPLSYAQALTSTTPLVSQTK